MASSRRRKTVVLGFLGTTLDQGREAKRWDRWRPTVALGQHETLEVDRLELLHSGASEALVHQVVADLASVSPTTTVRVHALPLRNPWDFESVYDALLGFAEAYAFDDTREDYLVHLTTGTHVVQICLFLLTESRHLPARLLQTSPGRSGRPPGTYQLIDLDLSRYDRIAARFAARAKDDVEFLKAGIETRSEAFHRTMSRIEQVVVRSSAPLLLEGPTGAGKTALAARIYGLKKARHLVTGEFVEVNCATLRGDGAMSALFGHVKGAFTGAIAPRPGLLARADGGVLFLDEIAELGLDEQAMLLRAIESKVFLPVGADREVKSDFQLLAGTHQDLARAVREGRFRADLLARIDLWTFRLPALRERLEDLEPNLDFELARAGEVIGTKVAMSVEARRLYLAFGTSEAATWPRNFRDLAGSVTRLATLAEGGRIGVRDVEEELPRLRRAFAGGGPGSPEAAAPGTPGNRVRAVLPDAALDRFDAVQLEDVLAVCEASPSLSAAGRALFEESLGKRTSSNDADRLRKYLARFGLRFDTVKTTLATTAARAPLALALLCVLALLGPTPRLGHAQPTAPDGGSAPATPGQSTEAACVEQAPQPFLIRGNWQTRRGMSREALAERRALHQQAIRYRTEMYGHFEGFGERAWNPVIPASQSAPVTFFGKRVRLHRRIHPAVRCVEAALQRECTATPYQPRKVSGLRDRNTYHNGEVSNHVYGIAIDIDSDRNTCCGCVPPWNQHPLCQRPADSVYERMVMPECWVHVFERYGFYWLGHDTLVDTMHFEFLGDPGRLTTP